MDSIQIRLLESPADHRQLERAQSAVWGPGAAIVFDQTLVACRYGGIALGAFDGDELAGFCYSWPAFKGGDVWLHSHLLGVMPAYRGRSLGEQLKQAQRTEALRRGYRRMTWTFDPLEAPNARLNLGKLGATARVYEPDYYGQLDDDLNRGLPSDRLLVEWDLAAPAGGHMAPEDSPYVNPSDSNWDFSLFSPVLRLRLPSDIRREYGTGNLKYVLQWRMLVRDALRHYFEQGYALTGFSAGCYVLERTQTEQTPG